MFFLEKGSVPEEWLPGTLEPLASLLWALPTRFPVICLCQSGGVGSYSCPQTGSHTHP